MTDADAEDIVTAVSDDVTVEKSFEPDDFPVPAIAFAIRSERDTAVSVRLVDTVPDDVAPENIGFHPKYGAEFWDVEDGRIVFQRDFDPGEEYTTVYGLRGGDADTAAKFMSEPTLESVEPVGAEDDVDAVLDAAKMDDLTSSEGEAVELAVSEETERADPSTPTTEGTDEPRLLDVEEGPDVDDRLDAVDATERDASTDDSEPSERLDRTEGDPIDGGQASDTSDPAERDSLVSELAAEIREGNVDDEALMTLRDALGLDLASASVEARIEHLQSEVSDLEAYTDALEEFLDEEGDAQTLIAEARDGHEVVVDRLDELETRFSDVRSELDERLGAIDETIDDRIDSELEDLRSEIESVEERLETERDARSEFESEIERLSTELAKVAEMRDRLANALGGLAGGTASSGSDADSGSGADGDASASRANEGNTDQNGGVLEDEDEEEDGVDEVSTTDTDDDHDDTAAGG